MNNSNNSNKKTNNKNIDLLKLFMPLMSKTLHLLGQDLDTETIKIKEIYYATIPIKKILSYVENSDKILWNILSGCFSSGIWLQEEIWNKDDLWKDNNN